MPWSPPPTVLVAVATPLCCTCHSCCASLLCLPQLPNSPAVLIVLTGTLAFSGIAGLAREHSRLSALKGETFFLTFRRFDALAFWRFGVLTFRCSDIMTFWRDSTLSFEQRCRIIARKAAALCPEMYSLFYEHTKRSINAMRAIQKCCKYFGFHQNCFMRRDGVWGGRVLHE